MKKKLYLFKEKYPIILSIFITILWMAVFRIAGIIFGNIPRIYESTNEYILQIITDFIATIFGIFLIVFFGYKKIFKEKRYGKGKTIVTGLYLIIMSIIVILSYLYLYTISIVFPELLSEIYVITYSVQPLNKIVFFIITMILVGTAEEFTFRGLIANVIFDKYGKSSKGVWFSTFMTGTIFGSIHLFNAVYPEISFHSALVQAIGASVLGMVLTAIYYRTRDIWFLVFLHAFNNFAALFGTGILGAGTIDSAIGSYSYVNLIAIIPYVIVLLVLLRKSKMEEILEGTHSLTSDDNFSL